MSIEDCHLHRAGFLMARNILSEEERLNLADSLGPLVGAGRRGLLAVPEICTLARSSCLLDLIRRHFAAEPFPVRAIYFDKSEATNWTVAWHQDLTIAVRSRIEVSGFGPWSKKDGIPSVQPPAQFLERMLTLRLHFDAADESNGALRVIPRSHRFGRLSAAGIRKLRSEVQEVVCATAAGDALLMRPLLRHSSGRSRSSAHRRVLHLEYADFALPGGLQWNTA